MRAGGGDKEERAAVVAAQHHREAVELCLHPMGDLTSFDDAQSGSAYGVGVPDASFGVVATAIGNGPRHRGPQPAVLQPSLGPEIERGELAGKALSHDEGSAVRSDDRTVGERQAVGRGFRRAVCLHQPENGGSKVLSTVQVEPEVAHVGPPLGVHCHVVAERGGYLGEVAMLMEGHAVVAHDPAVSHRHHQEVAVGHPPQPRWLTGNLHDHLNGSVQRGGVHGVLVEVGVPETAVVPPGTLAEIDSLDKRLRAGK